MVKRRMKIPCLRKEQEMRYLESQKNWSWKVTELGSPKLFFIQLILRWLLQVRTLPLNCGTMKLVNASKLWENTRVWSIISISIQVVRCLPVVLVIWLSSYGRSTRIKSSNASKLSKDTSMRVPALNFLDQMVIILWVALEIRPSGSGTPIVDFC